MAVLTKNTYNSNVSVFSETSFAGQEKISQPLRNSTTMASPEWLESYGTCCEHLFFVEKGGGGRDEGADCTFHQYIQEGWVLCVYARHRNGPETDIVE